MSTLYTLNCLDLSICLDLLTLIAKELPLLQSAGWGYPGLHQTLFCYLPQSLSLLLLSKPLLNPQKFKFYYVYAPYIRTKFLCSNPNVTIWKQKFEGISPQQILIQSSNLLGYPNKTFFQYFDYNKIMIIVL